MKKYEEIMVFMEEQWKESTGKKKEEAPPTEVRPQVIRTPSLSTKKVFEKHSSLYRTPGKPN